MAERTNEFTAVVEKATAQIEGSREDAAKLYSRIRVEKTTLAYIWVAGKDSTRIDLYTPEGFDLPKAAAKAFAPGRGRARKEGLIATLAEDAKASEVNAVVAGIVAVAKAKAEPTAEPTPEETDADIKKAALDADLKAKAKAQRDAEAEAKRNAAQEATPAA